MTLAVQGNALAGVWFNGQAHQPDPSGWPECPDHPVLLAAALQLHEYFAGERRSFNLPLQADQGTAFQRSVWGKLGAIGFGSSTSYRAIAAHIGRPGAARAVGAALGRNPLLIVQPCHRIVGAHGNLSGYAAGLQRKMALLELESRF